MHNFVKIAGVAPLVLALAACGNNPARQSARQPASDAVKVTLPTTDVAFPDVPLDAKVKLDFPGTYQQKLPGGGTRSVTLNSDGTFIIHDGHGIETTGNYSWLDDNSRVRLGTGKDAPIYAVADGTIYRMAGENSSIRGPMSAGQAFAKVIGPGGAMPASSTPAVK